MAPLRPRCTPPLRHPAQPNVAMATAMLAALSTPPMPEQVQFGIVGGGYWTERYLMVCRELPERFRISGMVVCAPFHPHPSPHGAATR